MEVDKIICGKCEVVLKAFPDNCIDTIITDPPYGLSFMGKDWDSFKNSKIAKSQIVKNLGTGMRQTTLKENINFMEWTSQWAKEALRVIKPGGTMLCFAGSRTQHLIAFGIELSGWILKDCIMWLYGSGFPKASDISKQIDKKAEKDIKVIKEKIDLGNWLKEKRGDRPQKEIAKYFLSKTGGLTGCIANWEKGYNLPTWDIWIRLKEILNMDSRYDHLIEGRPKNYIEAEREVIGKGKSGKTAIWQEQGGMGKIDITIPATPEATLWNGWKSHGLKPAYEPILVAMKPNEGSYANNALKWGVAGLNIDGGRIETKNNLNAGRYPANIILDEEAGRLLDEQSGISKDGTAYKNKGVVKWYSKNGKKAPPALNVSYGGQGGASRFFYCAKASKSERNRGCEEFYWLNSKRTTKEIWEKLDKENEENKDNSNFKRHNIARGNIHPTVKSLSLMKYLCTITKTPTGGILLDPFCGSGTTLIACKETGRDYIGIEKDKEYVEIANKRIKAIPKTLF